MSTVTKSIILIYIIIAGVVIVVTPILMKLGMHGIFQTMAYWFIFIGGAVLVGFHLCGDFVIWAIWRITGNKIDWFDAQEPESNREPEDWISMVFEDVITYLVFGLGLILLILG